MVNFLALLGWNPGEDEEIMTRRRLIEAFDIKRIHPKSCAFDEKKLEWMNNQYIMQSESRALLPEIKLLFADAGVSLNGYEEGYILTVIGLLKERCRLLTDFVDRGRFFFEDPTAYNAKAEKKHFKKETASLLRNLRNYLGNLPAFETHALEMAYKDMAENMKLPNAAPLIHPTRLAVSGMPAGPGLFEMLALLGKETVLRRLRKAEDYLSGKF
jgi:glutamyl-tRNA synthetase